MKSGSRFAGMMQIVRFNPRFYIVGALTVTAGTVLLLVGSSSWPAWMRWGGILGLACAGWWLVASLAVSHVVYDLSDWPCGRWLAGALGGVKPSRLVNVHSGFDETTARLHTWLPGAAIITLDVYNEALHTEHSLRRARTLHPPGAGTLQGRFDCWPEECRGCDAVLFLLSAHEFRTSAARRSLLAQARQALHSASDGVIVLAEHARDAANFFAFGPGFMHFHSTATWESDWKAAGLTMTHGMHVTPFLRVWTLRAKNPA